ncbi:unnamed protein product [Adineta steineri]|uniref:Uncharacterized protein n=1 Tax=Adineta steineri TaxID=433720 RepID=A0A819TJT3_9BILA|nr:unnamed protein product [Adineta steineri]CAF4082479.1 unnamed protein product [Adineta steineri]
MAISNYIRSWILLVPLFPSIMINIFALYHFVGSRALRTALNNHVIIVLLFYTLIAQIICIAWQSHFLRTGTVLISTPAFCYAWIFTSGWLYVSIYYLMAWVSIERHILIFHSKYLTTKFKRLFFHYFPLMFCILWPLSFYSFVYIIIPCNGPFLYNVIFCARFTCLSNLNGASLIENFVHQLGTTFITLIFNVTLFIRVVFYRQNAGRMLEWRKYKKMAIQLFSLCGLYLGFQLPGMILNTAYTLGMPRNIASDVYYDSVFCALTVIQFMPMACAMSLPNLRMKCQRCVLFWRTPSVVGTQVRTQLRMKVVRIRTVVPIS